MFGLLKRRRPLWVRLIVNQISHTETEIKENWVVREQRCALKQKMPGEGKSHTLPQKRKFPNWKLWQNHPWSWKMFQTFFLFFFLFAFELYVPNGMKSMKAYKKRKRLRKYMAHFWWRLKTKTNNKEMKEIRASCCELSNLNQANT